MNEQQNHALAVLANLTKSLGNNHEQRKALLLTGFKQQEGYCSLPADTFCAGWAYKIGPHFANCLDIKLQRRMRYGEAYYIWTQGSAFDFKEGYVLLRADEQTLLQVKAAWPAVPGSIRNPGLVQFTSYAAKESPGTWLPDKNFELTQDDFIKLLIKG